MERLISSYRYVFHKTNLHRLKDINLKLLIKYGNYQVDPNALDRGDNIFPKEKATFKHFVQFLIHGKEDFKDEDPTLYTNGK